MTNREIIEREKKLHNIEEDLYTFIEWKKIGYSVKKGEKAKVQTKLWKKVNYVKVDEDEKEHKASKFVLVNASLFTRSQVEIIKN